MSNKKLTTEEKIVKSKEYEDEMTRLQNKMKTMRTAKKKLDAEIADELEKAEMVTNQAVGKKFRSKMTVDLPLKIVRQLNLSLLKITIIMKKMLKLPPRTRSFIRSLVANQHRSISKEKVG